MAIAINGSGTVTGISVGGLPDGIVDAGTLATNSVDSAELIDGSVDDSHLSTDTGSVTAKTIHATYDLSTASGTQDITGFGFTPSALFGWFLVNVTDDWGMGFTDFTMNRAIHSTNTTTAVLQGTAGFCNHVVAGGTVYAAIATITDGVRLTWTKGSSPTGTLLLYLLGIK